MARNNKAKLNKIYDTFDKFGVDLDRDSIWEVQGTPVVYHKDVERLGAAMKIQWDIPTIIRAEKDEAVIQVVGRMGDRMEWSIGEAVIGVNYRVSGKQAAYVWAMAEKRAKDRVILKMADLHGDAYSEEEADDFKDNSKKQTVERDERPARRGKDEDKPEPANDPGEPAGEVEVRSNADLDNDVVASDLKQKIAKAKTINAVTDLMLHADTQQILNNLPEDIRDEVRDFAKARLTELGWPSKKAS